MVYLELNKKNHKNGKTNLVETLNKYLTNKSCKTFMLIYMEGCGPCNATRPEWSKLNNILSNDFKNKDDIMIVSVDKDLTNELKNVKEANSFPTIRFITNAGENVETYEDSDVQNKDRTIDSFVEWIKMKTGENNITKNESKKTSGGAKAKVRIRKTRKIKRHWSNKYKSNINCKRPRGFSQRQYCKYGRSKYKRNSNK